MTRDTPWAVLLAACFAAAAFALLLHDIAAPREPLPIQPPAAAVPPLISPPAAPPPASLQIYAAIAARPVFIPSRRPPPPSATPDASTAAPPVNFTLVGVIKSPSAKFGVIRQDGTPDAIMVRQGDTIAGWTLTDVGDSSITLEWHGTFEVLKIMP